MKYYKHYSLLVIHYSLVFKFFITSSLSLHFLFPKFVNCTVSCPFPANITISHSLAISQANLMANVLSGIVKRFFPNCLFFTFMVNCSRISSLFSVSGSSSVAIRISLYCPAISHIIGLLVLSLHPGAQKSVISLPVHFILLR